MLKASPLLIVEEDHNLRALLAERLAAEGFLVTVAATGPEALALFDDAEFAIVVLSLTMPGIPDARGLIRRARDRQPGLKSLFLLADSEPVYDDPERDGSVAKPSLRVNELIGCVWELFLRKPACEIPPSARLFGGKPRATPGQRGGKEISRDRKLLSTEAEFGAGATSQLGAEIGAEGRCVRHRAAAPPGDHLGAVRPQ
jgi:CheY-like chemotaxis protein